MRRALGSTITPQFQEIMRTTFVLILFAALGAVGTLAAQAGPSSRVLAASVLPLPEALRAGAGVRVVAPSGVSILRPSANGLMCTADRPGDDIFDVRCYTVDWLAVMDYVGLLRQQGVRDSVLDARLRDAERQGVIRFPDAPTAGYRMLGPITALDAATASAGEAIDKWQSVHFPFRTAAELGLPITPEDVMPYVMASGTWWSHVMIVHRPRPAALPS
jgi:hypothetical protein